MTAASTDPRAIASLQARTAILAVAKAHTLLSGATSELSPERRVIAEEGFDLLETAVRDLRSLVAMLENVPDPVPPREELG